MSDSGGMPVCVRCLCGPGAHTCTPTVHTHTITHKHARTHMHGEAHPQGVAPGLSLSLMLAQSGLCLVACRSTSHHSGRLCSHSPDSRLFCRAQGRALQDTNLPGRTGAPSARELTPDIPRRLARPFGAKMTPAHHRVTAGRLLLPAPSAT